MSLSVMNKTDETSDDKLHILEKKTSYFRAQAKGVETISLQWHAIHNAISLSSTRLEKKIILTSRSSWLKDMLKLPNNCITSCPCSSQETARLAVLIPSGKTDQANPARFIAQSSTFREGGWILEFGNLTDWNLISTSMTSLTGFLHFVLKHWDILTQGSLSPRPCMATSGKGVIVCVWIHVYSLPFTVWCVKNRMFHVSCYIHVKSSPGRMSGLLGFVPSHSEMRCQQLINRQQSQHNLGPKAFWGSTCLGVQWFVFAVTVP